MNATQRPSGAPCGPGSREQDITDCAVVLAESAIENTGVAECEVHAMLAVADFLMKETAADHLAPSPDTWWLSRSDGRKVAIYRLPEAAAR